MQILIGDGNKSWKFILKNVETQKMTPKRKFSLQIY